MSGVIFCGDFHLDKNHKGKTHNHESIRILDAVSSMQDIVYYCEDNNVELLVFTGDMFEDHNPSVKRRGYLYEWLHQLRALNVEVLLLLGNHDIPTSKLAQHGLTDLAQLGFDGVRVIEDPELLHYDDFDLALIPWDYNKIIPEFVITRNTICAAHCSTFENLPYWEDSPLDFQIPKEYFTERFDFSFLGHIHTHSVIQEEPFIAYPGSLQRNFGSDGDLGFYHMDGGELNHIKYNLRKQEILYELPHRIDPETIYKFCYTDDEYSHGEIDNAFKGCFSLKIDRTITKKHHNTRFKNDMKDLSPTEVIKEYCKLEEVNFAELEDLWIEISQE